MFALLSITCFIYRIIRQNILERQNVVVAAYMSNRHFKGVKKSPVCQAVSGIPFPNRNLQSFEFSDIFSFAGVSVCTKICPRTIFNATLLKFVLQHHYVNSGDGVHLGMLMRDAHAKRHTH